MRKRGQASVEFMVVAALALLAITGVVYALSSQIGRQSQEVDLAQINKFGNALIDTINKVSYLGEESTLTIEQVLPANVVNITLDRTATAVSNRTIIFWYDNGKDIMPLAFYSPVDVVIDFANYGKGVKRIEVTSKQAKTLVCLKQNIYSCNNYCEWDKIEGYLTAPSDCCTAQCYGCTANGKATSCKNDTTCHPECYGHNGCQTIC